MNKHRGIFLTHSLSTCLPTPLVSGTLYHASYIDNPSPPRWVLESREVSDLSSSKSLVLLYRIQTFNDQDMLHVAQQVEDVLRSVPLGREERTRRIGPCKGNPVLGGYDCVIVSSWSSASISLLLMGD
jgi:hypothetical protein